MSDELKQLLKLLAENLNNGSCNDCCDCTTTRQYEHSAARFNELQAFAAAESSKQFVQQQAAMFASLLKQVQP